MLNIVSFKGKQENRHHYKYYKVIYYQGRGVGSNSKVRKLTSDFQKIQKYKTYKNHY